MSTQNKIDDHQRALDAAWPYAAFALLVFVYSFFTLGHGFNATDEGYLLSLGARVADGEAPYTDFFFFRTPLSVYIQAGFIKIFGDGYTVLVSRVVWTIQMFLVMVMMSALYRRFVKPWELLVLLTTTYAVSTLLMSFPWYNYDALFFAVLAVVMIHYGRYGLAGLAAFLAFMCKQNYVVFLPAFLALAAVLQRFWPQLKIVSGRLALRAAVGFVVPLLVYLGYLLFAGCLGAFWDNVFVYPRMASQVSIWFTLFQNHHEVFYLGIPAALAGVLWYHFNKHRYILALIAVLTTVLTLILLFQIHHNYIYSLVYLNLALSVAVVVKLVRNETARKSETAVVLLPVLLLGGIIQYAAGFNYAGIVLAHVGTGLSLAVLFVFMKQTGPTKGRRFIALGMLCVVLAGGLYHKYTYVYRDVAQWQDTESFSTEKLRGISSNRRNVQQIDDLVKTAQQYTGEGEYILAFPDFPALYYLADRKNPTPVGWFVQLEFGSWIMRDILESLETHRPRVIFAQRYFEIDFERSGALINYASIPRYVPIVNFINQYYRLERTIGDIHVFLPKS